MVLGGQKISSVGVAYSSTRSDLGVLEGMLAGRKKILHFGRAICFIGPRCVWRHVGFEEFQIIAGTKSLKLVFVLYNPQVATC